MNNISSINGNNNTYRIDNDTLSRAILTFCIDGADAIMYNRVSKRWQYCGNTSPYLRIYK